MALIPAVGRKSLKMRALVLSLYIVLTIGAVIMVYPFLVMLGSSVASQVDQAHYDIVPRYLYSRPALFGKYAEDKYDADMVKLNAAYGAQYAKLDNVVPPAAVDPARVRAWDTFVAGLPPYFKSVGFGGGTGISYSPSPLMDRYIAFLRTRFHNDVPAMDRAYAQEDELFETAVPPFEQPTKQSWTPGISPKDQDWATFEQTLPAHYFMVVGADPIYRTWLKEEVYPHPSDLSKAWGTNITDFNQVTLSVHPTGNAMERRDWETFVRTKLPFRDVHVDASSLPRYQQFLASRYGGKIGLLNTRYGTALGSFSQVAMPNPNGIIPPGPQLLDWLDFLKSVPLAVLSADTPETRWRTFAKNQFHLSDTETATLPLFQPQSDWAYMQAHPWELRRSYLTRNYSLVLQYMVLHGRAVWNTVLYCSLAVLIALIVNPLCAYALSRYNLSYGSSVLLFLLATMAFPAEVTMIPNFLLLKDLGLLNTFSALVLPTAASGFSIFLMKGFFDSLPKELYEAGMLDGAGEGTMFRAITLPLSKPIFAVIALQAFTGAYGAFLFAMLYCQDASKWTLMVWLYQLQASAAPEYIMMAALTLAAIPTLLIFVFAQNTIMKGIILPSFK